MNKSFAKTIVLTITVLLLPVLLLAQGSQQMYVDAKEKYLEASYEEAAKLAERVKKKLGQTNPKIEALLAQAYFYNGDIIEAKIAYEKLLKLTSSQVERSSSFEPFLALGQQIDAALEKAEQEHEENVQKERNREAEKIEAEWQAKEAAKKRELQSQPKDAAFFYNKAKQAGTKEAYNDIASAFPNSKQAGYAKNEIGKINEEERRLRELERQRKERERERALRANKKRPGPPLIDPRDGQRYETVKMGNIYMAENLNYKIRRNSYKNNVDTNNPKVFGRLYTRKAAMEACPPGWTLPNPYHWADLLTYVKVGFMFDAKDNLTGYGDYVKEGKHLKSKHGWEKYNERTNGFDNYGFSALPAGFAVADKGFLKNKASYNRIGYAAYFWVGNVDNSHPSSHIFVLEWDEVSYRHILVNDTHNYLASIRCVKNN